jgi:hypothetical protein
VAQLTIERIAAVQAHVVEAVARTTPSSVLPESEQDLLLAQSCAEACDLLGDWLTDPFWARLQSAGDGPVRESVPAQREFTGFLGPALKDAMAQAGERGISIPDPDSLVDKARQQVVATTRRYPRLRRQQLFSEARRRVEDLRDEVCKLVSMVKPGAPPGPRWRQAVRWTLSKVPGVLLALVLALVAPSAIATAQSGIHAVEVMTAHHVAAQVQPAVPVAPAHMGPRVH